MQPFGQVINNVTNTPGLPTESNPRVWYVEEGTTGKDPELKRIVVVLMKRPLLSVFIFLVKPSCFLSQQLNKLSKLGKFRFLITTILKKHCSILLSCFQNVLTIDHSTCLC